MTKRRPYNPIWIEWADKLYKLDQTIAGLKLRGPVMGEKWYERSLAANNNRRRELLENEPEQYLP